MKRKHLSFALGALLVASALWLARTASRNDASHSLSLDADDQALAKKPEPGETAHSSSHPAPPDPSRRFRDFTPEQRVEFARKGHGPGG